MSTATCIKDYDGVGFLKENKERNIKIVFNVFKDIDYELYNKKIKELN